MTTAANWQRARTNEQKRERIDALIQAAGTLFDRLRYDDITIAAIAEEAGFTRSNTYKYFRSKEELFLQILKDDFQVWAEDILSTLIPGERYSSGDFALIWTGLLLKHFRLLRLLAVLFTKIEKNLPFDTLVEFKRDLKSLSIAVGKVICSIYPELSQQDAHTFFTLHITSAMGLYQMADHSDTQNLVMSNDEFKMFRVDLGESCRISAKYILEGLLR